MVKLRTNILSNVVTLMATNTILCCVIVLFSKQKFSSTDLTPLEYGALILNVVTLVGWLIWAIYVILRGKVLKPMDGKAHNVIEWVNGILFAYWILIRIFPVLTVSWLVPAVIIIWLFSIAYVVSQANSGEETVQD